jgi:hypothetical protein
MADRRVDRKEWALACWAMATRHRRMDFSARTALVGDHLHREVGEGRVVEEEIAVLGTTDAHRRAREEGDLLRHTGGTHHQRDLGGRDLLADGEGDGGATARRSWDGTAAASAEAGIISARLATTGAPHRAFPPEP